MTSIKDNTYQLPFVQALRIDSRFETGSNIPLLIHGCEPRTGEKTDFVVKLLKAERMADGGSQRELLAAFMAMELGLPVVTAAAMEIDENFVALNRDHPDFNTLKQSKGPNFATYYREKLPVLAVRQKVPNTLVDTAQEIFVFDILIQNADRTHESPGKPNIMLNSKELLIFDHEAAFGFLFDLPFSKNPEPWNFRDKEMHWMTKHCLIPSIKGISFNEPSICKKLCQFDDDFWTRAWSLTPEPWRRGDQFKTIKEFITQIVDNRIIFARNLQTLLL